VNPWRNPQLSQQHGVLWPSDSSHDMSSTTHGGWTLKIRLFEPSSAMQHMDSNQYADYSFVQPLASAEISGHTLRLRLQSAKDAEQGAQVIHTQVLVTARGDAM
jgi:hypothetical protein